MVELLEELLRTRATYTLMMIAMISGYTILACNEKN